MVRKLCNVAVLLAILITTVIMAIEILIPEAIEDDSIYAGGFLILTTTSVFISNILSGSAGYGLLVTSWEKNKLGFLFLQALLLFVISVIAYGVFWRA